MTSIGSATGGPSVVGKLAVLPSGPLPASPGEFVGTAALARMLADLRQRFDLVLVDAPPICVVGDAMTLSARVDALIVITRLGTVDRRTLDELHRELTASPSRTLGVVITGIDNRDTYGHAGYYHSESPRPQTEDERQQRGPGVRWPRRA